METKRLAEFVVHIRSKAGFGGKVSEIVDRSDGSNVGEHVGEPMPWRNPGSATENIRG